MQLWARLLLIGRYATVIDVNVMPDKDGAAYDFTQSKSLLEAAVPLRRSP